MDSRADALEELVGSLRLAAAAHHEVARDATGHLLTEAANKIEEMRSALYSIATYGGDGSGKSSRISYSVGGHLDCRRIAAAALQAEGALTKRS